MGGGNFSIYGGDIELMGDPPQSSPTKENPVVC